MLSLHDSFDRITALLKQRDKKSRFLARQLLFLNSPLSKLVELYLSNNEGQLQNLDKFPMMRAIYDNLPDKLLLRCSRKTLKSTLLSNIITLNMIRYNFYRMLYASPNEQATKLFSHNYLSARLSSPGIQKIITKVSKNDVFVKEIGDTQSNVILTYACEDATRTRGPAVDSLFLDEVQGMNLDILPIIAETMAISKIKRELYAGTPLTTDNTISTLWNRANQLEWVTRCSCNHWNSLTEGNEPMKMIQKKGLSCIKCGKVINTALGQWVDFNPGEHEIQGFHLAQPILPYYNQDEKDWLDIFNKCYNRGYSIGQVHNEVFGLPFDIGAKPITEQELKALCVLGPMNTIYARNFKRYVYITMGCDFGVNPETSRTVCTLMGLRPDGYMEVFLIKIFRNTEYESQIREMAQIAKDYQPNMLIADSGPDPLRGKMLGNLFDSTRTQLVSYREGVLTQHLDVAPDAADWSQIRWVLNRSETLGFTFRMLKNQKILLPRWEDSSEAIQDILGVFIETNDLTNRIFYRHSASTPDDALHALSWCTCAANLWAGDPFFTNHYVNDSN